MESVAFEIDLTNDGDVASIRLRGFEVLAAPAHSTSSVAAPWEVTVQPDRVRIQPAAFEPAQSMVWPFRFEPDVEVILRGHDLMPMAGDRTRELHSANSVRLAWPGRGAISAAWDRPRLPAVALTPRPAARSLEMTLAGGETDEARPTAWWLEIRDGSGAPSIEVVDYDPAWPVNFSEDSERILAALGDLVVSIHHGGSTSVPGLAAKPVIDIWIGLRRPLEGRDVQAMAVLGLEHLGEAGLAGQDLFVRRSAPRLHVHCYPDGDREVQRHLDFRRSAPTRTARRPTPASKRTSRAGSGPTAWPTRKRRATSLRPRFVQRATDHVPVTQDFRWRPSINSWEAGLRTR